MLHLLYAKTRCCLLLLLAGLFSVGNVNAWQTVSLSELTSNNDVKFNAAVAQIVCDPFHILFEHAVEDYRHYFSDQDVKMFDLSVDPVFEFLHVGEGGRNIFNYGAFLRAQFNYCNWWVRGYDLVGQVIEKQNNREAKASAGADDVVLKVGYDVLRDSEKHFSPYVLAGFPTHRNLKSRAVALYGQQLGLVLDAPAMGSKNFNVGCGLNCAYTLSEEGANNIAFLWDIQYAYSIPATYTNEFIYSNDKVSNVVACYRDGDTWKIRPKIFKRDKREIDAHVTFSSGQSINNWFAFHIVRNSFNAEFGCATKIDFAAKPKLKFDKTEYEEMPQDFNWSVPSTMISINPYVSLTSNMLIGTVPCEAGVGLAYEFNQLVDKVKFQPLTTTISSIQGCVFWGTVSLSF